MPPLARIHNRIFLFAAAAAGALVATASGPAAQEKLNCGAYAAAAVAQNQQNVNFNCGFSGPRWSSNYNDHFNWCGTANMAALTAEDRARADMLKQCAAKPKQDQAACQAYAKEAVAQQKANKSHGCGLSGGAWSEDYAAHFDWCLGADQGARNTENNSRNQQLAGCLSAQKVQADKALKDQCATYATFAVAQAKENASRRCGNTGGRWSADWQSHFNWCLGAPQKARQGETAIRVKALKEQCFHRVCKDETVAKAMPPFFEIRRVCRNVPNK